MNCYTCNPYEKNTRILYINTISAFASHSRSVKYTHSHIKYPLCRVNLQEFCVFTSKSTWIEYGAREKVVDITPEQGYYNVSNVETKIFVGKKDNTAIKKLHERRTNKKGSHFVYTHITHTHPVELINFLDLCAFWDYNLHFIYARTSFRS